MADEERTEETSDQTPGEQTGEAAAEEQAPAGEQSGEEQTSATEETPGGETPETGDDGNAGTDSQTAPAPDAEAQADEPDAEAQADEPAAEGEEASGEDKPKAKDQPPGAELEPIAIEPERELSAEERARREAEEEERARREAEATAEDTPEDEAPRKAAVKLEGDTRITATGKRKSSIARVIIVPGDGKVTVNKLELETYFPRSLHQSMARQPLVATGYDSNVDVRVNVHGGGISGQAGAVRHGIARALVEVDPELRGELKRRGYLTRDARRKERRKAGLKKARKRPQFSKR
jgi:small subunit ribosomal protein S9